MDTTELHYLTYERDEIMKEMLNAYIDAGGDILYPGDEKSMLLSSVQAILMQAFAGIDHALRMGTLRYAVGEYLDAIGETRMCERMRATAAEAEIEIMSDSKGVQNVLAEGLALTADGVVIYTLNEDVTVTGDGSVIRAGITCETAGSAGNALGDQTVMQFMIPQRGVLTVKCIGGAAGGNDEETDDDYRERIRTHGAAIITTGTKLQYEAAARDVSTDIIDVRAVNETGGTVGVYLILKDGANSASVINAVTKRLNGNDTRPLTDTVTVKAAEAKRYTINAEYHGETGVDIADAVDAAVKSYIEWQDQTIGKAFNPDKLMALMYNAGCSRVMWGSGSSFDGGALVYTDIGETKCCTGTVSVRRTN